jgi:aspartate 1-decarboxylase
MLVKILKAKLHRAVVTDARLDYAGSIAIDSDLMKAVGILPYESVLVANLANGERFETYAVEAEPKSGKVSVLGAAAKLVSAGDRVIIFAFAYCKPGEVEKVEPKVLVLDDRNRVNVS